MTGRDPHVIGMRIARRRHQLDWTQIELAARLGVSPSTVANWERGASYPKKKLGKIEQVLGISLDNGNGDDGPPDPVPEGLKRSIRQDLSDLPPEAAERVIDAVRRTLEEEGGPPAGRHRLRRRAV